MQANAIGVFVAQPFFAAAQKASPRTNCAYCLFPIVSDRVRQLRVNTLPPLRGNTPEDAQYQFKDPTSWFEKYIQADFQKYLAAVLGLIFYDSKACRIGAQDLFSLLLKQSSKASNTTLQATMDHIIPQCYFATPVGNLTGIQKDGFENLMPICAFDNNYRKETALPAHLNGWMVFDPNQPGAYRVSDASLSANKHPALGTKPQTMQRVVPREDHFYSIHDYYNVCFLEFLMRTALEGQSVIMTVSPSRKIRVPLMIGILYSTCAVQIQTNKNTPLTLYTPHKIQKRTQQFMENRLSSICHVNAFKKHPWSTPEFETWLTGFQKQFNAFPAVQAVITGLITALQNKKGNFQGHTRIALDSMNRDDEKEALEEIYRNLPVNPYWKLESGHRH